MSRDMDSLYTSSDQDKDEDEDQKERGKEHDEMNTIINDIRSAHVWPDDEELHTARDVWGILLTAPPSKYGEEIVPLSSDAGAIQALAREEFLLDATKRAVDWLLTAGR